LIEAGPPIGPAEQHEWLPGREELEAEAEASEQA